LALQDLDVLDPSAEFADAAGALRQMQSFARDVIPAVT
jgi:hypothetical protein